VFETGIGGRYDPVRLVGAPVTCVTSVDYEHVDLLGHSLQLIARQERRLCVRRHDCLRARIAAACSGICLNYNRNRYITRCLSATRSESATT